MISVIACVECGRECGGVEREHKKKIGKDLRSCDTEFSTSDNNVPKTTVPTYMANIENIRSSEF